MTDLLETRAVRGVVALLLAGSISPHAALAAESYDTCTGFIDATGATIREAGTWCLRADIATEQASGNAITIAADDVTVDCNGYTLSGLAAGPGTLAQGIATNGTASRATVRNCSVQGFYRGISVSGGSGHLVEGNRLDSNTYVGIKAYGANSTVRGNRVYDTGAAGRSEAYGVYAMGDVIDNTVAGVLATKPYGVVVYGTGSVIQGNTVQNLVPGSGGFASGILAGHGQAAVSGNRVTSSASTWGLAINGYGAGTFCKQNIVSNYASAYSGCEYTLRNLPAGN